MGLFQNGLDLVKSEKLVKKLMFKHLKSLAETFEKAEGFIVVEEAMASLKQGSSEKSKEKDKEKLDGDQRRSGGRNMTGLTGVRKSITVIGRPEEIVRLFRLRR